MTRLERIVGSQAWSVRGSGAGRPGVASGLGGPLLVLLLAVLTTFAGPLEPKRSREPLSALAVERPLVLPRGWFELGLVHSSGGGRHRQDLGLRYGLTPELEVFGLLPVHEGAGPLVAGDTSFGLRLALVSRDLPTSSVAAMVAFTGASGPDSPVGPNGPILSVGAPGAHLGLAMSQQVGALRLGLDLRGSRWFRGVREASWQLEAEPNVLLQGGPLVLRAGVPLIVRRAVDLRSKLAVEVHVSRGLELGFEADLRVLGDGDARLPSEGGGPSRFGPLVRVHF